MRFRPLRQSHEAQAFSTEPAEVPEVMRAVTVAQWGAPRVLTEATVPVPLSLIHI
jgi:hypothetical protein